MATAGHVGGCAVLWNFSLEGEVNDFDYNFRLFQGSDSQWYITIEHANGQALYTSEGYTTKQAAVDTLENFLRAVRCVNATATEIVARHSVSSTEVQS